LPLPILPFEGRSGQDLPDPQEKSRNAPEIETDDVQDATATMTLSLAQFIPKPALPFLDATDSEKHGLQGAESADDPATTMFLIPGTIVTEPALPFQTAQKPAHEMTENVVEAEFQNSVSELSLEEHAALCARLAASRGDSELIFAQYGLSSPDVRRTVDALWKKRLETDSALYEKWQRSYRIFEARLRDASPKPRSG
jgi:hypothetical protein